MFALVARRRVRTSVLALTAALGLCTSFAGQAQKLDPSTLAGAYSFSGKAVSSAGVNCASSLELVEGTISIDSVAGFRGTGTTSEGDILLIDGTVLASGDLRMTIKFETQDGEKGSVTGVGVLSNDMIKLNANGNSNLCDLVILDAVFTRIVGDDGGGGVIVSSATASSAVTAQAELSAFTRGQPTANSMRMRTALRGNGTGALALNNGFMLTGTAAGNGDGEAVGAWFGYSRTDTKNNLSSTAMSSDRDNALFGLDTMVTDGWLLGVSFGLERTEIDTQFNAGEQSVTAITVAPYVGGLLNDWLTFDASLGYSDVRTSQFRTLPGTNTQISSDVESSRLFANVNLSATHAFGSLLATGQTGLLWATQRDDAFAESNGLQNPQRKANIGRWLFGGELAYSAGAWEPYVHGLFEYDFSATEFKLAPNLAQPKNDTTDILMSLGLRYFADNGVSGSVEYSRLFGRANLSENTLSAQVRWQF